MEKISVRYGIPVERLQEEFIRRAKLLYVLYKKEVFGFNITKKIINDYYKSPEDVLRKYQIE